MLLIMAVELLLLFVQNFAFLFNLLSLLFQSSRCDFVFSVKLEKEKIESIIRYVFSPMDKTGETDTLVTPDMLKGDNFPTPVVWLRWSPLVWEIFCPLACLV